VLEFFLIFNQHIRRYLIKYTITYYIYLVYILYILYFLKLWCNNFLIFSFAIYVCVSSFVLHVLILLALLLTNFFCFTLTFSLFWNKIYYSGIRIRFGKITLLTLDTIVKKIITFYRFDTIIERLYCELSFVNLPLRMR